jgi:hypothetical protein
MDHSNLKPIGTDMEQYLFHVEIGDFAGKPGASMWAYNVKQTLQIFIEAESLSQASRTVEHRFGDYTRCRYKFIGKNS